MDSIEQVALSGQALARAMAGGARRALVVPWACDFALHAVVILLFWNFARTPLSPIMAPALEQMAGESALHYPDALIALPDVLWRVGLGIDLVWLPIVIGWSVALFGAAYRQEPEPGAVHITALRRAPGLVAVGAPLVLLRALGGALALAGALETARRPLHGVASALGGLALEGIALALAAVAAGVLAIEGGRWGELRWRTERVIASGGGAMVLVALACAGAAFVLRLGLMRWILDAADARPDLVPVFCLVAAACASIGGLVFSGAIAIVHASVAEEGE